MSFSSFYAWIEGDDDKRIFDHVLKPLFETRYDYVETIPYSGMTNEKVEKYITSIISMRESDYIFIADIDTHRCITSKKQWIQRQYKNIDPRKIIVVAKEIESWYLAGVSDKDCKKLRISPLTTTDHITKEMFNADIPTKFKSRIDFMYEILSYFSIEIAITKNQSLNYLIKKLSLLDK